MVAPAKGEANITVVAALTQVTTDVVAAEVTLTNVAAQHALPSGEGGFRELALVASLVDRYGVASAKRIEPFLAQKKRVLAYGKPEVISLRFLDAPRRRRGINAKVIPLHVERTPIGRQHLLHSAVHLSRPQRISRRGMQHENPRLGRIEKSQQHDKRHQETANQQIFPERRHSKPSHCHHGIEAKMKATRARFIHIL